MHAITGPWITHHSLKKLQRQQTNLQNWLDHIKRTIKRAVYDHEIKKNISLILFEKEIVESRIERIDKMLRKTSLLPTVEGHKASIRAFRLPDDKTR